MILQFSELARRSGRLIAMLLILAAGGVAQSSSVCKKCVLYGSEDKSRGQAVIFGRNYEVPELHLRYIDRVTNRIVIPERVNVHYYWEWLEYPYPEHPRGAWSDAEDWMQCPTEGNGEISLPAFTVKPRGWYAGKYTKPPSEKKPRFDRIEIVIELDSCAPRLIIKPNELSQYRNATAVVKVSCGKPEDVTFEPR